MYEVQRLLVHMKVKHSNVMLQDRAFTYYIKDYDVRKRIYTLENPITKDIKVISKEEFDKIYRPAGK